MLSREHLLLITDCSVLTIESPNDAIINTADRVSREGKGACVTQSQD